MAEVPRLVESPLTPPRFAAFAATGVLAGLVLAIFWILVFGLFLGGNFLLPIQLIGAHAFGPDALLETHLGAFFFGLILHLIITAAWGVVFGMAANGLGARTWPTLIPLGLITGMAMQVINYIILTPAYFVMVFDYNLWRATMPPGTDWLGHALFGATLGLSLPLIDRALVEAAESRPAAPTPAPT